MTTADLQARVFERLNEDANAPIFYTAADTLAALNLMQRIYAFLTLCLESTRPLQLTPGTQWYTRSQMFSDMIVILRCGIQISGSTGSDAIINQTLFDGNEFNEEQIALAAAASPKLAPATFDEMASLDNGWIGRSGLPTQYDSSGFGLLVFDRSPDQAYMAFLTYARMPVALVNPTDAPEIPEPDHQALIDGAVGFLRIREGGQELANDAPAFGSFMSAVARRADQVRARSLAQRYDRVPIEIAKFDISRLLNARPDLKRRNPAWTSQQ